MNISININQHIKVKIYPQPKKQKSAMDIYDIYLLFSISENGVQQCATNISTCISVNKNEWGKKQMNGKHLRAEMVNNKLTE